jgi:hypothetical protein
VMVAKEYLQGSLTNIRNNITRSSINQYSIRTSRQ